MFEIIQIALVAIVVVLAITVHEYAHGFVAAQFGDPTAKHAGRLTINPLKHIDMIGTVVVPLSLFLLHKLLGFPMILFGWAKPVPVIRSCLRSPRLHMSLVALAGPLSNFIQAFIWAGLFSLATFIPVTNILVAELLINLLLVGVAINVLLMCVNLIPLLPLDGGRVVLELLPIRWARVFGRTEKIGLLIVVALLVSGIIKEPFLNTVMGISEWILAFNGISIKLI